MSAITPPGLLRALAENMPAKKRQTNNVAISFDSASPISNSTNTASEPRNTGLLPNHSEPGPQMNGPVMNPVRKRAVIRYDTSFVVPNSSRIESNAALGADEANVTVVVASVRSAVMHHFRSVDQFCGLEGSEGPSQVTSQGSGVG
jgi:hypothetical protein